MGKGSTNKNLPVASAALAELGATVVREHHGKRHIRLQIRTANGTLFWFAITQSTSDQYKLRGWLHQQVRRADARAGEKIRR